MEKHLLNTRFEIKTMNMKIQDKDNEYEKNHEADFQQCKNNQKENLKGKVAS